MTSPLWIFPRMRSDRRRREARAGIAGLLSLSSFGGQALVIAAVLLAGWYIVDNTSHNLQARGIATGFAFLWHPASIPMGSASISFTPGVDTYARAILVGVINTLKVSGIAILLSTLLGTLMGLSRLSPNWLLSRCAAAYVEAARNVPLLLQLLFWYQLLHRLPGVRQAFNPMPGVYLSNRSIRLPALAEDPAQGWIGLALLAGMAVAIIVARAGRGYREATGERRRVWPIVLGIVCVPPLVVWALLGAPLRLDMPVVQGFDFRGGAAITPEFAALIVGLTVYAGAFVAEIVRAGVLAVPRGQGEAAASLGLRRAPATRLIILPQALRIIVPPLASEYLGIIKNSSLAVVVGYQDLVSIVNTTLNETGQAVEGVAIVMVVFLVISGAVSFVMNFYDRRIALVGR
jgi:general L-amino acid transport system permease protein